MLTERPEAEVVQRAIIGQAAQTSAKSARPAPSAPKRMGPPPGLGR